MKYLSQLSLLDYAKELQATKHRIIQFSPDYIWIKSENLSITRFPTFCDTPPNITDVYQAFQLNKAVVASFICKPSDQNPANSWLYICHDNDYKLSKLSKNARRDVRRAFRELEIKPINLETVLKKGFQAFKDTRTRVGLSDGTYDNFCNRMEKFSKSKAHHFLGAYRVDKLVAFTTFVVVEDFVEIEGSFSTDEDRETCPNNGIVHFILDHFLVERNFKSVSYGLSTIQKDSNEAGLHFFKTRVHFEAQSVCRMFIIHPWLHPFLNNMTLKAISNCLSVFPGNRKLKKMHGVMASMLNKDTPQDIIN